MTSGGGPFEKRQWPAGAGKRGASLMKWRTYASHTERLRIIRQRGSELLTEASNCEAARGGRARRPGGGRGEIRLPPAASLPASCSHLLRTGPRGLTTAAPRAATAQRPCNMNAALRAVFALRLLMRRCFRAAAPTTVRPAIVWR